MTREALDTSKRWFEEVWNQRRLATVDELLSDESVCYGEGDPIRRVVNGKLTEGWQYSNIAEILRTLRE